METGDIHVAFFVLIAAVAGLVCEAGAATISVPGDFSTIQDAINAANDGDEIVIGPGTYTGDLQVPAKSITLRSSDPNDPGIVASTVIESNLAVAIRVLSTGMAPVVIEGLTITGGDAATGGGINVSSSTVFVRRCVLTENNAIDGGAIGVLLNSSVVCEACIIQDNTASEDGGALSCDGGSKVVFVDCTVTCNFAGDDGGAIQSSGEVEFRETMIMENSAGGDGGGIFNNGDLLLLNVVLAKNTADGFGGGMFSFSPGPPPNTDDVRIVNSTIAGNSALFDAGGAGVDASFMPLISNTLSWGNSPNGLIVGFSGADVSHCLVQPDGPFGPGNFSLDPLFVDPAACDFRLQPDSPAIDAGLNSLINSIDTVLTDIDGNPRFVDGDPMRGEDAIVDIGAYEFQNAIVCAGDCDANGTVDFNDLVAMLFEFGVSDDGRCDADGSGAVDFNDLVAALFAFGPCP
ncbi:unnamed protein product [Symbiodinium necroappetens]|uniref:Probable pectate lyase C n=1 Tax=Symbiodinium necroappetens TaxID=1628268 RepID=A0A812QNX5_9DINO|nr:unnamed protein product [Symbiodinium necroappetens]